MDWWANNFATLAERLPQFADGVLVTVLLTLGGALGSFIIALIFGIASSTKFVLARVISRVFVEFFRGTSLLVQMFFLFFVLPQLGFKLEPLFCGILALALNYGAYGAEVVRGSIASVPKGQFEAVNALSLSPARGMFRVVLPQAWALMIPSFGNLLIQLLKGSAIVSFITLHDLYFQIEELRKATGTWFAFGLGLLVYFVIAYLLTAIMNALEIVAKHSIGRGPSLGKSLRGLLRPPDDSKVIA